MKFKDKIITITSVFVILIIFANNSIDFTLFELTLLEFSGLIFLSIIPTLFFIFFDKEDDGAWLGPIGFYITKVMRCVTKK